MVRAFSLNAHEDRLIQLAANEKGVTWSAFVNNAATEAAHQTLEASRLQQEARERAHDSSPPP